jgi:2-dehydro-3-deoxygluconokinase
VLDVDGDAAAVGRALAARHDIATVVVTRGSDGALAVTGDETVEQAVYPASDAHPVGTGDAFVGGFLSRYAAGGSLDTALEWASATAALKRSIPGDVALVSPSEVEAVIDEDATAIDR